MPLILSDHKQRWPLRYDKIRITDLFFFKRGRTLQSFFLFKNVIPFSAVKHISHRLKDFHSQEELVLNG